MGMKIVKQAYVDEGTGEVVPEGAVTVDLTGEGELIDNPEVPEYPVTVTSLEHEEGPTGEAKEPGPETVTVWPGTEVKTQTTAQTTTTAKTPTTKRSTAKKSTAKRSTKKKE